MAAERILKLKAYEFLSVVFLRHSDSVNRSHRVSSHSFPVHCVLIFVVDNVALEEVLEYFHNHTSPNYHQKCTMVTNQRVINQVQALPRCTVLSVNPYSLLVSVHSTVMNIFQPVIN